MLDEDVARLVPERVVDVLEPIEVEQQHGGVRIAAAERETEPVLEQGAVGKASEAVVERDLLGVSPARFELFAAALDSPQQQANQRADDKQRAEQHRNHLARDFLPGLERSPADMALPRAVEDLDQDVRTRRRGPAEARLIHVVELGDIAQEAGVEIADGDVKIFRAARLRDLPRLRDDRLDADQRGAVADDGDP